MSWRCIGCDKEIGWDGKGTLCYTCSCGAHIFYEDHLWQLAPPASLVIAIHEKKDLPHLDYLVGKSDYTSSLKERLIEELKSRGAIWMKDCKQCLEDGTYQRTLEMEKADAMFEVQVILHQGKH